MLRPDWRILILLFIISIGILIVSTSYGQELEINTDDEASEKLIEEFKEIMSISEQDRTPKQWNRAIEIIFTIYKHYDVTTLIEQLKSDIEKYEKLQAELHNIINELEIIYEKQQETYLNLTTLQDNLISLYNDYADSYRRHSSIFLLGGYTINLGLNIGMGILFPVKSIIVGGIFDISTNFSDNSNFTFSIIIGLNF